jgi:acetyltransferase-like isoleucine patch superfamily enzyme
MLIENIIRKLKGNPDYKWESVYQSRDLFIVLYGRSRQMLRGMLVKILVRSPGLIFVGTGVKIKHAHLISAGRNLIIEDGVYLNALSTNGIRMKNNVTIARNSTIICTGVIAQKGTGVCIGNNTGINANAFMAGQGGISIGDNVIIGPGVKIFSENHVYSGADKIIKDQGVNRVGVMIEDNCWIGASVTILDGVTIGEGCVIAAGSVVTKSIAANSIARGVPAKVLKSRISIPDTDFVTEEFTAMKVSE